MTGQAAEGAEEGRALYAVVYERPNTPGRFPAWVPGNIVYMRAKDAANARFLFLNAQGRARVRIVGIAPAVGYHVLDEHGDKLTT